MGYNFQKNPIQFEIYFTLRTTIPLSLLLKQWKNWLRIYPCRWKTCVRHTKMRWPRKLKWHNTWKRPRINWNRSLIDLFSQKRQLTLQLHLLLVELLTVTKKIILVGFWLLFLKESDGINCFWAYWINLEQFLLFIHSSFYCYLLFAGRNFSWK